MKLHLIYLLIGLSTLALNALLTIKLIRENSGKADRKNWEGREERTFSLTRDKGGENATTEAVQYDDTVLL